MSMASYLLSSDDVPHILSSVAELAARYASAEAVVADTDRIVLVHIREVVCAFCHGADKDADALFWTQVCDIVSHSDHWRIEGQSDFPAVRWQMIRNRILDDFQKLFLRRSRSNRELVKQLNHEASKALESTRYAYGWGDLNEHALCGMDVYLQLASFVDWRVE